MASRARVTFPVLCCITLLLGGYSPEVAGAAHTLSTTDQGWYNSTGAHNTANTNTITGGLGAIEYRSWFKFVIPSECADGVQSAQFSLNSVFGSRGDGGTPHLMSVNDVVIANATGIGVSTNSVAIYNDLGNGSVGNFTVAGNGDFSELVTLSAVAHTDLENAAGTATRQYALGVQHLAIVPLQYVMGFSQAAFVTATLDINCEPSATITLNKTVQNNYGGTAVIGDFTPSVNGSATSWGISSEFAPGNYLVTETSLAGYSTGDWTGDCAANGSLTLVAGQDAICSIVNMDEPATLTLNKTVTNSHGGTATSEDFTPSIDGNTTTWGTAVLLSAGAHMVTESSLLGYTSGDWAGDCNADGTIVLALGEVAACSIENRDLGVDLAIAKTVNITNPNIGDVLVFTLQVENAGPDTATNVVVTDSLPAGFVYQTASIAGGDSRNDSDPSGSGLSWSINSLLAGSSISLNFAATVQMP